MRAERNRLRRSIATLLIVAMICSSNSLWVLADSSSGSSNGNSSTESTATASNADADSSDTEEDEGETASDSNSKASDADAEAEEELENDLDFYAMMNIPYADFYAAEVNNDVPVDAFTSATKSKTTNTNLAGGSYHEDSSAILGVTYPVHITAEVSAELDAALEVADEDDLFGSPSYSWYNLNLGEDETPDFYKEVTLGADGYEFDEVEGDRTSIEGSATLTTETSYGDYQLDVTADQLSGTVNGIVIHTDGHDYGLRHLENYWKPKNALAWCTGFTTSVHNCPTSSEHYESMMGETITGLTYYTTDGIYEIDLDEIYVPIITDAEIVVEDASVTATYTSLTISGFPSDFEREYAVYNSDGDEMTDWEVTVDPIATVAEEETETVTLYLYYGESVSSGLYTLSITDASGTYAAVSYEFNLYVDDMPVVYDAETRALVASSADAAEGTVETYVSAITSVEVDGTSYNTGNHGTTIINSDGSVKADAAPIASSGIYAITVHATGYQDLEFVYWTEDELFVRMNIPYAEFYEADVNNDVPVDGYTSATMSKTLGSLASGAYHVSSDGSDLTGVMFPVKVSISSGLTTDGKVADTDTLAASPTWSFVCMSEDPDFYKELTVDEDGEYEFGALVGDVTTTYSDIADELTFTTETSYGDYELDVNAFKFSSEAMYGVIIHTEEGTDYGLRHLENYWRPKNALAWCTGFTTAVHGCPTSSAHYESIMGQTITGLTYIVESGIYEVTDLSIYVPIKTGASVEVADTNTYTTTYTFTGEVPFESRAVYTVTDSDGNEVNAVVLNGSITLLASSIGSYTLTVSDSQGEYADLVTTFTVYTTFVPAVYNENNEEPALVVATGANASQFESYISNISSVTVNGTTYNASGHGSATLINSDGTLNTEASAFASGEYFEITVSSTGYVDYSFVYETGNDYYVLMNIPYAEFYAAEVENDVPVDAVTSATLNKTRTMSLVGGSYHVDPEGTDITGVTFPVKVPAGTDLSAYTHVYDTSSVTISVTNRGTASTTTYEGSDALFESESYSYYLLSEAPEFYKEMTVAADGTLSFGSVTGTSAEDSDATAEITATTNYGDYQISVDGIEFSTDEVYGVVLHTAEGTDYGLRHLENIWRSSSLAFATGYTTAVHGSPTSSEHYASIMGKTITGITYYTDDGIHEITVDLYVPYKYVLMNIPYAEFYEAEGTSDVDAYSSATTSKPLSGSLAGGSYHVNADGTDITGAIFPVKLGEGVDLSDYTQITDASSVTITTTNRGQTSTTTYTGSDALFESGSYSYYVLSETPSFYKEVSVDADGNLVFGAAVGEVTSIDATAELSTGGRHTDYELSVDGITDYVTAGTDQVYGVTLTTSDGTVYGLRHVVNIWRVSELGWDADEANLAELVGKTITGIKYFASTGIYEIETEVEVPEIEEDEELDTTALEEAIETAEALTESDYTSDSWEALEAALAEAADALANATTQDTIDAATDALNAAIEALVEASDDSDNDDDNDSDSGSSSDEEDTMDISELEAAIANAEAKTQSRYTASTWSAMQTALAEAKAVLAAATTQDEIDAATEALNAAIDALRIRSSSGGSSGGGSGSGSSSSGSSSSGGSWQHDGSGWWYRYTDGSYPKSAWARLGSQWYYFDGEGYACRGWQQIDGSWYYLDPTNCNMLTGWHQDPQDGYWYYLNPSDGRMLTGWQLINGDSYFFNPIEPAQPTWTYSEADEAWNYTNASNRPFGSMYVNEATPDGYQVDANGAWVQ